MERENYFGWGNRVCYDHGVYMVGTDKTPYKFKAHGWFITIWRDTLETYGFVACKVIGLGIRWVTGDVEAKNKGIAILAVLAEIQPNRK